MNSDNLVSLDFHKVGNSDESDAEPDNPMMARDRAKAHKASGHDPNAVQNVTVTWYVDTLGFPESAARALYTDQMLTSKDFLVDLTDKSVDEVYSAIRKLGGASQGDPTPVLAIERLKLTVFCHMLYERTSQSVPA